MYINVKMRFERFYNGGFKRYNAIKPKSKGTRRYSLAQTLINVPNRYVRNRKTRALLSALFQ